MNSANSNDDRQSIEKTNPAGLPKLSTKAKLQYEVIQSLLEPPDRQDHRTYSQRLTEAAQTLGVSVRTVRRLMAKFQQEGLAALDWDGRSLRYRKSQSSLGRS